MARTDSDDSLTRAVPITVIDAFGLLLTAWRVYFRLKIGRFWWEDVWAGILLSTGLCWIITAWTSELTDGLAAIVSSWIYSLSFTCIVTLARMSVLFSIIRIIHGSPRLLKFMYACAASFAVCWVILVIEKSWQCATQNQWEKSENGEKAFCRLHDQISIFEFITDCVAISILVVLPLCILWRVKLPRRQRRMILSIFASSIVLAVGALFHTIGQVLNILMVMSAGFQVEVTLSLIVCNLLVAVTYTYRFLLHDSDESITESTEDDDFTTRPRSLASATPLPLTSINLDVSSSGSSGTSPECT